MLTHSLNPLASFTSFEQSIQLSFLSQLLRTYVHLPTYLPTHLSTYINMKAPTTSTKQKKLTRDLRLQAQTLRSIGWKYSKIAEFMKITLRQVQYACFVRLTSQRHLRGRKSTIDADSLQFLIEFVCASAKNRQMPYKVIPWKLRWDVSEDAIRLALKKEEFSRRIARRKPSISKKNRLLRLAWAHEHLNWIKKQWQTILWSDETWVNGSRHRKIWITRRSYEEYDFTCIVSRLSRKNEWMFWGCFSRSTKELCVFWKKEWDKINKKFYCEHIVPVIHDWMRMKQNLFFMQNNASGHAAKYTREELENRDIRVIDWSSYSSDLNLIEAVWNIMKNWIQKHYDDQNKLFYNTLRNAVRKIWDAVTSKQLDELIDFMSARCQIVIDADEKQTEY